MQVVIITGATSGIGKALAIQYATQNFTVVIAGRNKNVLLETETEINKFGGRSKAFVCDVTIEADCKNLIQETLKLYSRIDILICNAGISMRALFIDVDLDVLQKLMNTNFWGAVYCTKYALPSLLINKGSVVAISSIAGKQGLPARTGYSASKFALEGFMETLRAENLKTGLHVLIARPGFTASNIRYAALNATGKMHNQSSRDESKMMPAEIVAKHIIAAVHKRKRSITLTLQGKLAVFLSKFFPRLLDNIVYNEMRKEKNAPL
ncbi:MAG: SDR family oxidoreductase [Bacteroidia bacterium]|nr:SDR family oxidoreductase [Bacteroidia bacterium]HQV00172.1 SDR family oxidoreductase [Bacteroidia bacterium]